MTHQDLKKVIDFYNNVILQQIIKPLEITEIYKLVCPTCDSYINYKVKQRAIAVYVQNLQKEVIKEMEDFFKGIDSTETAAPVPMTEQSHSEDDTMDAINEMNEIEEELENSQLSDNHQSENSSNGDNQIVKCPPMEFSNADVTDDEAREAAEKITAWRNELETATDANQKRSLKQKINKMNKKMDWKQE